jgi:hypothetical protein
VGCGSGCCPHWSCSAKRLPARRATCPRWVEQMCCVLMSSQV